MNESVLNFGPSSALVGIVTRPPGPAQADAAVASITRPPELAPTDAGVAIVILNAGVIHRVGPGRLHVRLARTLAARGFPCLRFDLPGIGDSRSLGTGSMLLQDNLVAISAAFDTLERKNVARRFVVFGLCSGADHAFLSACNDPRVVGVVMVDPTRIFTTWRSQALRAGRWLIRPSAWLRLLLGHYTVLKRVHQRLRPAPADPGRPGVKKLPPPASPKEEKRAVKQALKVLVARRVQICYLITGSLRHRYNYRRQLLDAFSGIGLEEFTQLAIFPDAIHTLPSEEDRARLEQTLIPWLEARFNLLPDSGARRTDSPDPTVNPGKILRRLSLPANNGARAKSERP